MIAKPGRDITKLEEINCKNPTRKAGDFKWLRKGEAQKHSPDEHLSNLRTQAFGSIGPFASGRCCALAP